MLLVEDDYDESRQVATSDSSQLMAKVWLSPMDDKRANHRDQQTEVVKATKES